MSVKAVSGVGALLRSAVGGSIQNALHRSAATTIILLTATLTARAQSTNGLSLVASGLSAPSGLTLGPGHRLFVSDATGGMIYRVRADGMVTVEATGFSAPRDVIFDRTGDMYVADSSAGKVYKLDRTGHATTIAENLQSPCCLGFDGEGNLLVAHETTATGAFALQYNGAISRIAHGGKLTLVASGFLNPQGLLVDREGDILIAAEGYAPRVQGSGFRVQGSGLYRVDELGQVTRVLDSGSITPRGVTLSPEGTLFFSGTLAPLGAGGLSPVSGSVFLSASGTFSPFVTGLQSPRGLVVDSRSLYVADEGAGEIWRVMLKGEARAEPQTGTASGSDAATTGAAPTASADSSSLDVQSPELNVQSASVASPWGYTGTPDYVSIPITPEGVPSCPDGNTCVMGRVLRTDDLPLGNVTVRLLRKAVRTNSSGYWILSDVPAGRQILLFDGRSADAGDIHYPISMLPWEIKSNTDGRLPFNTYFPILDTVHKTTIGPGRETVHTTPLIPGLEIRIPAGTSITSIDGTPVTEITATIVPPDKPLYPLGLLQDLGCHITLQPGGAVASRDITIIYSNPAHFPPGTRAPLWQFDPPGHFGWWEYASGTVSPDGRQVVPDGVETAITSEAATELRVSTTSGLEAHKDKPKKKKTAGFRMFGCGLISRTVPVTSDNRGGTGAEPVDLAAGTFRTTATDLVIPGLMPIVLQRTYRNQDNNTYAYGVNMLHSYEYRLYGTNTANPSVGASTIQFTTPSDSTYHFVCVTNNPQFAYICTNDYRFAGATIYQVRSSAYPTLDGWNFTAVMKNGTKYDYDGKGYLCAIRDANNNTLQINRVHQQGGNVLSIVQPSGRNIAFTYNAANLISKATDSSGRSVGYVYDATNRLVAVTNALGGVTQYAYDASNNMTSVTLPNAVPLVQNFYDSSNRVTNQVVASGAVYSIGYTISTSYVTVVSSSLSGTAVPAASNFNDGLGFRTNQVDALANTNSTIRGSRGEIVKAIDPLGRTNSFVYDANFNVIAITNAQGKATKFTYESNFNRLTSVVDPLGRTNSFGYDGQGNLTSITNSLGKITKMTYNQFGQPLTITDPLTNTYTYSYNDSLDLVSVTDPLSNQVSRLMDSAGRPFAFLDSFSRAVRINYDALDRITGILDPINGQSTFGHDLVGNLTNVVDALTHSVNYTQDSMNRLSTRTDPLGKFESYFYDSHGNLTNFVDRRGISMAFKYDLLDRRTGIVYGAESSVRLLYDKVGRVTNVVDSVAGSTKLTYDSLNRLTQVIDINGTITYAYNDAGRRTNMTVAGQNTVFYRYDNANRLTNVTQGTFTTSLFYDDLGRRTKLVLPNAINVLYGYDAASRLTNITYLAAVTNKIDYGYDQTGNRVSQNSGLSTYNLPSAVTNSTYDAANHQLVFGSYNILYDANGNVTNIISGTITNKLLWSARNQLTNMLGAVTASFGYDGVARRITRTVTGNTEKYLYDGLDVIQQLDASAVDRCDYFRGPGVDEPWQRIDTAGSGGSLKTTNRVYLIDALGSIVALTDTSKVISNRYAYEPFGVTTNTGASNKNSFKFTGREDDGTGIYYFRARYYHPGLGRFLSEDPIRYRGGDINLYGYVGENPINVSDPTGLDGSTTATDVGRVVADSIAAAGGIDGVTTLVGGSLGAPVVGGVVIVGGGAVLTWTAMDVLSQPCATCYDPFQSPNNPPTGTTSPLPDPDYKNPPYSEPKRPPPPSDDPEWTYCTAQEVAGGCYYTCDDGSSFFQNKRPGADPCPPGYFWSKP